MGANDIKETEGKNIFLTPLRFERLKDIHNKIASEVFPNSKELAETHDVSVPTISRDIDVLKGKPYFAPIGYNAKERGYFYTEDYDFPLLNTMNPKQLQILTAAKTLLSQYKGTPLYKDAEELLATLSNASYRAEKSLLKRIALPPSPEVNLNPFIWDSIVQAMEDNRKINIQYSGRWRSEVISHLVHPYQLLLDDGVCFLWGYSEERKDIRLFNLSRILRQPNITRQQFSLPDDYEFETHCGGGKFGAFVNSKKESFEIDFYDDARAYVRGCKWADDQKLIERDEDNTTTIIFSASQYNHVMEWVLAQGPKAKPIGPEHFVEEWRENIRKMARSAGIS